MKDLDFCKRLTEIRKRKGLTHSQIADKSSLTADLVRHYESGERAPGLESIKALCKGLSCTASELIGI